MPNNELSFDDLDESKQMLFLAIMAAEHALANRSSYSDESIQELQCSVHCIYSDFDYKFRQYHKQDLIS